MSEPRPVLMHFPGPLVEGETRQYQLAQHVAATRRVVYVADGPGASTARDPVPRLSFDGDDGKVTVVTRTANPNYWRLVRRAPAAAAALNAMAVRRLMRQLDIRRAWTYTFGPLADWQRMGPGVLRAVEVIDPPFFGDADAVWEHTASLCRGADLVVATATEIVDQLGRRQVDAHIVHNAVSEAIIDASPVPPAAPPVALYLGTVDWRFDHAFVEAAAAQLPEVDFVIAGRVNAEEEADMARLRARPNVRVLGMVPEREKAQLLATASVGLVPFLAGPVSDGVNPTKVYEYSGYGLPVVAEATRACRELAPPVCVAETAAEFAAGIAAALASGPRSAASIEFARANTWAHRARRVDELLTQVEDPQERR